MRRGQPTRGTAQRVVSRLEKKHVPVRDAKRVVARVSWQHKEGENGGQRYETRSIMHQGRRHLATHKMIDSSRCSRTLSVHARALTNMT